MIVTLSEMKDYLGIADNSQDAFLTQQLDYIQSVIEGYCGRKFELANYEQTFYYDDYKDNTFDLVLAAYPVVSLTLKRVSTLIPDTEYRLHKATGSLLSKNDFFQGEDTLLAEYSAGYANVPVPVKQVVYNLVEERYNKKKSGVALNFGSDVQSISIPGVINVQFDYSLDYNQRKNAFGSVLGSYSNILDPYRSERPIIGQGRIKFVEEV